MNRYVSIKGKLIPHNADLKIRVDAVVNTQVGEFTFVEISDVKGMEKEAGEVFPVYKVFFREEALKEYHMQISEDEYASLAATVNIKGGKGKVVREFE